MKKILFAVAMVATTLFASCSKSDEINHELATPAQGSVVNLTFSNDEMTSRTFFSPTATAETWEKSLSSVTMFVFDNSGDFIVRRSFTPSELSAKSATFSLPNIGSGAQCSFYVVANNGDMNSIVTESALLAEIESSAAHYNGTFAEVSTKAKRSGGFMMSGNVDKTISDGTTDVAITLKRTVAKVAIEVSKGSSFNDLYSGDVRVDNIILSGAASQSKVIKPSAPSTGAMNYSHTQSSNVSSGKAQNLFYIFESGVSSSDVTVTINATYDRDGNFSTTLDQADVEYNLTLNGSGNGVIARNGYYRVAASINGLTGADASLSITVAEWEIPTTQSVNLGN